MSYTVHFIVEFILNGSMLDSIVGRKAQVVARYEREMDDIKDLPQPGVGWRGVAPGDLNPTSMVYDVERNCYIVEAGWGVCHTEGDCYCQQQIRAYLADARWALMSPEIVAEVESESEGSDDG